MLNYKPPLLLITHFLTKFTSFYTLNHDTKQGKSTPRSKLQPQPREGFESRSFKTSINKSKILDSTKNMGSMGELKKRKTPYLWWRRKELEEEVGWRRWYDDHKAWKRKQEAWSQSRPYKCFALNVFFLKMKKKNLVNSHSHIITCFLPLLATMMLLLLSGEEFDYYHKHTQTLMHTLSPNFLFMSFLIIFLRNLVTKAQAGLDKCPRSRANRISWIFVSIILFNHFS